jgi:D-psicose/D-tagatose/L-ribulose 3-epimerase
MVIGCHGSVWSGYFDDAGLRIAIEGTAQAGFDLIELPIFDPDAWNIPLTKQLLADNGLAVTVSLGLTDDINISSEDPTVVANGEERLGKIIRCLGELGGTHLVGVIYAPMKKNMRPATALEVKNGQDAIRRLGQLAAAMGVQLGIEVVNRYENNICNTAKQGVAYVKAVGLDNVQVHIDTYHMNIEESDMFQPVLTAQGLTNYVHIGESHRGYLGTGTVDFDTFFKALSVVKFDGPIVFESFSAAVVDPNLTGTLAIWRNLWQDGMDLAKHANAYIRGKLRAVETIAMH